MPPITPPSSHAASPEDRAHFCTYAEAYAAIPDELPFHSNGSQHVAVNASTGHRIPCSDAFIAAGYVAGSAVLYPQWQFHLEMGETKIRAIPAHPRLQERLRNPEHWMQREHEEREAAAALQVRERKATQAAQAAQAAYIASLNSDDSDLSV